VWFEEFEEPQPTAANPITNAIIVATLRSEVVGLPTLQTSPKNVLIICILTPFQVESGAEKDIPRLVVLPSAALAQQYTRR